MPRNHCHIKSSNSTPSSRWKIIAIIVTLASIQSTYHPLLSQVEALECACNTCEDGYCLTSADKHSVCQKTVKLDRTENGTLEKVTEFGCISASAESLAEMQCIPYTTSDFVLPTYVSCCRDRDRCNEFLADPVDSRFDIVDQPPEKPPADKGTPRQNFLDFIGCLAIFILGLICLFKILDKLTRFLKGYCMGPIEKKEMLKNHSVSSLKSKEDFDRFYRDFAHGSTSTQSYSTCDSIKKADLHNLDDTCLTIDMTSGVGTCELNPRTIAKAVALSQTVHVGEGRFGRVYKGEFHGEDVAVKAFSAVDQDSWRREDAVLRKLGNHPNIVRHLISEVTSVDASSTECWIILEYCALGSLCDYLDHNDIENTIDAISILQCIINGLNFLHEDFSQLGTMVYKPSIAHRDIKSRNILMRSKNVCCIADFGHALIRVDENRLDHGKYNTLQVGTVRYMAPEILSHDPRIDYRNFSTFAQADVYQFGLIMWEICYKTTLDMIHLADVHLLPYDGVVPHNPSINDMTKIVCESKYRPPPREMWGSYGIMSQLYELMCDCWRANPNARTPTLNVKKRINNLLEEITPKPKCRPKTADLNFSFDSGHGSNSSSRSSSTRHSSRDKTRSIA